MKELIEFIAKSLVENSEQVEVREVQGDRTTIIELKVAQEDMGKIIGKQGKTARSIRTLLNATAAKVKKKAVLEILE
ncbi:MAG: KH domain-containing protein [Nitrospinota bacterium]